jgi:hypothetical protein
VTDGPHPRVPAERGPVDPERTPADAPSGQRAGRRPFTTRQAEQRAALVAQSWPDFLRDLAIRAAIIAAAVIVLVVVLWLVGR